MKFIIKTLLIISIFSLGACELDLVNPNAATEELVLNTKDGLFSLAIGIRQLYSTRAYGADVLYTSVTARESAAMTTFSSLEELDEGGPQLSGENERVTRLFTRTLRVKGMAENLIASIDNVTLEPGTRSGLLGYARLFRAMCIGILAQNWEQVPLVNSSGNDAQFVSREAALNEAILILDNGIKDILANAVSDEYTGSFADIDILNALYAYSARYNLQAGNYDAAIAAADNVDGSSQSWFVYDDANPNPVYIGFFQDLIEYAPRTGFGLPDALPVDMGDARVDFYMNIVTDTSINNYSVEMLNAPFFSSLTAPIPVYLSSEMDLVRAEAYARKGDATNAETALNLIRNKLPADDPFGIGASLPDTWTANGNMDALLNEIYKNRRIELFLTGTSLEDSRRFGRPAPPLQTDFTTERNRNFYPYPTSERLSNPGTPDDPDI